MNIAISLDSVSLKYVSTTNSRLSLKETLISAFRGEKLFSERVAISNITLKIMSGEIIGVIGSNGAGKSSLLKLIAGILPPSTGSVVTMGQVAPMIELGAGFHPELSAVENIMVYGRLLGKDLESLRKNLLSILSWAELEDRSKDPVKTFSSGMLARLGFSIATEVSPEILLIDEVLAVGDSNFQIKSRTRMEKLMSSGATVIIVSHDIESLRSMCSRIIWLNNGRLEAIGYPDEVILSYKKFLGTRN